MSSKNKLIPTVTYDMSIKQKEHAESYVLYSSNNEKGKINKQVNNNNQSTVNLDTVS